MPVVIIPPIIAIAIIVFQMFRKKTTKTLSGKKVMMFGPPESGKTTFKDWLIDGKPKESYIQTGIIDEYAHYHDEENGIDYDIKDQGGSPEFLVGVGQSLYDSHDIILLFFNVAKYITDNVYTAEVNAHFDNLSTLYKKNKKPILIIGSYKDLLTKEQIQQFKSNLVNLVDPSKEYFQFLCGQKFVLADMFSKSDVMQILKEIKKLVEK